MTQLQTKKAYVGIPEEDVSGITEISYIAQDKELLIINTNEVLEYQIFNSQGQLLKSGTLEKGVETLSVSEFTPGAYIIQTHENNQNQCYEKFVVY
ncbi:MAG: T9SS type A sorting domain-containing protein [Flavobacteriales bacterium]|jgi:NACalpha-BTF3-like transcription factor|nr:T9SS type A sorting domain-containing protein [Flavobacteriales bacterium]